MLRIITESSFSDESRIKYRMIQFNLKNTRLRLDFSFFAVIALFALTGGGAFGFAALTACALHEMAHLTVMIAFSIPVDTITFYGAGIKISSDAVNKASPFVKNLVLIAGSAGNFIFALILWLAEEKPAAVINLFTGIFNLLPIGEYDGAVLLKSFVIRCCKAENVDAVMKAAGIVSAAVGFLFTLVFGGEPSVTLITTMIFLVFQPWF